MHVQVDFGGNIHSSITTGQVVKLRFWDILARYIHTIAILRREIPYTIIAWSKFSKGIGRGLFTVHFFSGVFKDKSSIEYLSKLR